MKKLLLVVAIVVSLLAVPRPAAACPDGSFLWAGGAPGLPQICIINLFNTGHGWVFGWFQ